jgi:hypothetical protein
MTTTSPPELDTFEAWVVEDGAFATDGGSIYLRIRTASGATHKITLWTTALPSRSPVCCIAGSRCLRAARHDRTGRASSSVEPLVN